MTANVMRREDIEQPSRLLLDVTRISACPLWANSGLMHRSKKDYYSITSPARLRLMVFWHWVGLRKNEFALA